MSNRTVYVSYVCSASHLNSVNSAKFINYETISESLFSVESVLFRFCCCFQVLYKTPVSITEHPKINEWLTLVEREMRVTLAKLLAESVTEVAAFNKGTGIDLSTYINWIDRYQVSVLRHGQRL